MSTLTISKTARRIVTTIRRACGAATAIRPEGEKGIQVLGHREYVGGMWNVMGNLQFEFVVRQGLKPSQCFLDIACGSLRGGVHFIRYLETGNYLGIDKEATLIELGIKKELGKEAYEHKKPQFVVSDTFAFERFVGEKPRFSLAQSLFSHLTEVDIGTCLKRLRVFVEPGHVFFATFFEGDSSVNVGVSHSHQGFCYSREQMRVFGECCGWRATYVGDWQHPSHQMMMRFEASW